MQFYTKSQQKYSGKYHLVGLQKQKNIPWIEKVEQKSVCQIILKIHLVGQKKPEKFCWMDKKRRKILWDRQNIKILNLEENYWQYLCNLCDGAVNKLAENQKAVKFLYQLNT